MKNTKISLMSGLVLAITSFSSIQFFAMTPIVNEQPMAEIEIGVRPYNSVQPLLVRVKYNQSDNSISIVDIKNAAAPKFGLLPEQCILIGAGRKLDPNIPVPISVIKNLQPLTLVEKK
jgi:hypothetical protein